MVSVEEYKEEMITVDHRWQAVCYWCGVVFSKLRHQGCQGRGWREHVNIEHETKIFCCEEHKLLWIYHKQVFGEGMP